MRFPYREVSSTRGQSQVQCWSVLKAPCKIVNKLLPFLSALDFIHIIVWRMLTKAATVGTTTGKASFYSTAFQPSMYSVGEVFFLFIFISFFNLPLLLSVIFPYPPHLQTIVFRNLLETTFVHLIINNVLWYRGNRRKVSRLGSIFICLSLSSCGMDH